MAPKIQLYRVRCDGEYLEKCPYSEAAVSLVTVPEQVRAGDSQCH